MLIKKGARRWTCRTRTRHPLTSQEFEYDILQVQFVTVVHCFGERVSTNKLLLLLIRLCDDFYGAT